MAQLSKRLGQSFVKLSEGQFPFRSGHGDLLQTFQTAASIPFEHRQGGPQIRAAGIQNAAAIPGGNGNIRGQIRGEHGDVSPAGKAQSHVLQQGGQAFGSVDLLRGGIVGS